MHLHEVTLRGRHVQLEPVSEAMVDSLWEAGNHGALWSYMPFEVAARDDLATLVERALEAAREGVGLSLAMRALPQASIVGSSSYLAADHDHRRVEIGATWITPRWQRSAINTESKYLMLRHAFEDLDCIRVEFKTDSLNARSRRALERIGAIEEGTLRNHMIMPDGRYRHSTYFSITRDEWPTVRERLEGLMAKHNAAPNA